MNRGRRFRSDGPGWRQVLFSPVESFLEEGESILFETKRHPVILLPFVAAALLLAIPTFAISLVLLLPPLLQMSKCRYIVTDRSVLARLAFPAPRLVKIPIEEIIEASVGEGPIDSKLGMGRIVLKKRRETFRFSEIRDHEAFLSQMMNVRSTI